MYYNLDLKTVDELMKLLWQAQEEQNAWLIKLINNEFNRRIKFDY